MMRSVLLSMIIGLLLSAAVGLGRAEDRKPVAKGPDRYALPQGGVPELLEFVERLTQIQPRTAKEDIEHRSKFRPALQQAAEKIQQLEKDKNSDAWRAAAFILLANRAYWIARGTPAEQRQTVSDVASYLTENLATERTAPERAAPAARLAATAAENIMATGQWEFAAEAFHSFGEPLSKSSDRDLRALGNGMELQPRRLQASAKAFPSPTVKIELPPKGRLAPLDFQGMARRLVADPAAWEGNHLAELPQGEQTLGGVRFRIGPRMLRMISTGTPTKFEGIAVDRSVARLYILHGAEKGWGADGTVIGQYKIHYADGAAESIPIVLGEDLRDWWDRDGGRPVTRGKVVWIGNNRVSERDNFLLRLYLGVWVNPHPDKKVATIDYLCEKTQAWPFCVAMTVEVPVGQPEAERNPR